MLIETRVNIVPEWIHVTDIGTVTMVTAIRDPLVNIIMIVVKVFTDIQRTANLHQVPVILTLIQNMQKA